MLSLRDSLREAIRNPLDAQSNVVAGLKIKAPRPPQWKSTMKTRVASIGGNVVLAFRAEDDEKARAMIDDQEGGTSIPQTK
jgi:hypothetical protein